MIYYFIGDERRCFCKPSYGFFVGANQSNLDARDRQRQAIKNVQEAIDPENLETGPGQRKSGENLSSSTVWLMVADKVAETCTASVVEEGVLIYSMSRGDLGQIHPQNNQTPIQLLGDSKK